MHGARARAIGERDPRQVAAGPLPRASREGFARGARLASRPSSSSGSVLVLVLDLPLASRPASGPRPRSDQTCSAASRRQTGGAWPHAQAAAAREATIREDNAVPWLCTSQCPRMHAD